MRNRTVARAPASASQQRGIEVRVLFIPTERQRHDVSRQEFAVPAFADMVRKAPVGTVIVACGPCESLQTGSRAEAYIKRLGLPIGAYSGVPTVAYWRDTHDVIWTDDEGNDQRTTVPAGWATVRSVRNWDDVEEAIALADSKRTEPRGSRV